MAPHKRDHSLLVVGVRQYFADDVDGGRECLALFRVEMVEPRSVIGKNTTESMQSGALYGFAAQVDGGCARKTKELGESTVEATGGLAALIAPFSEARQGHEPWLTLLGLRLIFVKNSPPA